MIQKQIIFFGARMILACDGNCAKAWGSEGRPRKQLSKNEDDYVYLGDGLIGTAPPPGKTAIYDEGGCCKPSATPVTDGQLLNKWCARQCERSTMCKIDQQPTLPDMNDPKPNIPRR